MPAARYKLNIDQGATLRKSFTWNANGTPVDLTGFTGRMQIRQSIDDADPIIDMTTANGGVIIGPQPGQFTLHISATDSAAFAFDMAVYDVELIAPGGDVTRILAGDVVLSREVTR